MGKGNVDFFLCNGEKRWKTAKVCMWRILKICSYKVNFPALMQGFCCAVCDALHECCLVGASGVFHD